MVFALWSSPTHIPIKYKSLIKKNEPLHRQLLNFVAFFNETTVFSSSIILLKCCWWILELLGTLDLDTHFPTREEPCLTNNLFTNSPHRNLGPSVRILISNRCRNTKDEVKNSNACFEAYILIYYFINNWSIFIIIPFFSSRSPCSLPNDQCYTFNWNV